MVSRPIPSKTSVRGKLAFFGAAIGIVVLALYPIVIAPMINPEKYSKYIVLILTRIIFI